jgi:hypothetical protein
MPPPLHAPGLSYEQINEAAESFLSAHHPDKTLPVPIEEIIEFDFGLDIVPFPDLQKTFDVDGFMAGDMSSIYVDDFIYTNRYSRYRFTLAHEIGHIILHKDILSEIRPARVSAWEQFIENVDIETYGWIEYQAYAFGGLVLVPRYDLLPHCSDEIGRLQEKIEEARLRELPKESYTEYVVEAASTKLAGRYDVSTEVMKRRISKEIEKGNITVP